MVKLFIFAILLALSPANGLIEALYGAEEKCFSACRLNYPSNVDKTANLDACKTGCNFRLHQGNCAKQCLTGYSDATLQSSCQVGCTINSDGTGIQKPIAAIDPAPKLQQPDVVPPNPEPERSHSIILIRLRQRPSFNIPSIQMPSPESIMNTDPIQLFNNILKQFQEKANNFEETIRKTFEENAKDLPKPSELGVSGLVKSIPIIRLPGNIRADSSSSESSEETTNDKRPLIDEFKHIIKHPREHQQYVRERIQPVNNRIQQFFSNVRSEWSDLLRKQPKIPIWIFLGILLSSSAILWYMVMSLCRHTPSRNALSIRAQELVFHPYEHDAYEKEKIQPDDHPYEATELPIKVKLSNI